MVFRETPPVHLGMGAYFYRSERMSVRMVFSGHNVNNLQAYRKYFSLEDLLDAVRGRYTLATWFGQLEAGGCLDDQEKEQITRIRAAFMAWVESADSPIPPARNKGQEAQARCRNTRVEKLLDAWQQDANKNGKGVPYGHYCALVLQLLDLAHREDLDEKEIAALKKSLVRLSYLRPPLALRRVSEKEVGVYEGEKLLYVKPCPAAAMPEKKAVFAAAHPDTGYIAITEDGRVSNRSAFFIPEIKERAVLADINQFGYAILLENGALLHNLPFADAPKTQARKFALEQDRLLAGQE